MTPNVLLKYIMLFLLLACLPAVMLRAADESYIQVLNGKIKQGDSCVVTDDKFLHMPLDQWNAVKHLSVKNLLTFEIRQDANYFYQSKSFTCTLKIDIKYYTSRDQQKPTELKDVKLVVNYDSASGSSYVTAAHYEFNNAFKVAVIVKSITSPEWGDQLPPVFSISNQIFVDRKYPFNPAFQTNVQVQTLNTTSTATGETGMALRTSYINADQNNNTVLVNWGGLATDDHYDEYDLEWTFIDIESAQGKAIMSAYGGNNSLINIPETIAQEWMKNDATRITSGKTDYAINLPYPGGFVLFRVRGVTYDNTNPLLRKEAGWKYFKNGDGSGGSIIVSINEASGHQPALNWQYNGSFAEEGKRKEVVSYYDASLRNRQVVTLDNELKKAIVAETIYDKMGRAALQVLPAPVNDSRLGYYPKLNLNSNAEPYSYADISPTGSPDGYCSVYASSMLNTVPDLNYRGGAAVYYSMNNEFLSGSSGAASAFMQYLPDAEGKPFSLTEYMPDNSGRIRRQGGVGPSHQIHTDHKTSYFYGKPLQEDLDRLFGTEAGYASHYLKTMVIDPNGQVSVSYTNSAGKTVATALAGNTPQALEELSSATSNDFTKIMMRSDDFQRDAASMEMLGTATFLAAAPGNFTLYYSVKPAAIKTSPGASPAFCSNCFYKVYAEVKNNCGKVIASGESEPFAGNDIACKTNNNEITASIQADLLEPGDYYISYRLRLSEQQVQFHEDYYIENNTDLKTLNAFVKEELDRLDLKSCYSDCSTCAEQLKNEAYFTARVRELLQQQYVEKFNSSKLDITSPVITSWIHSTWETLYNECQSKAANCVTVSPCQDKLEQLKMDVRPGGQYATYTTAANDPAVFILTERKVNVLVNYASAEYNNLNIVDDEGQTKPISMLSESDFIKAYLLHPEWADEFVKKHIEYCGYLWCMSHSDVYAFEDRISNFVVSEHKPLPASYYDRNDRNALLNIDPFFAAGNIGAIHKNNMQSDLAACSNMLGIRAYDPNQALLPGKDILQLVDWTLYCMPLATTSQETYLHWQSCNVAEECRSSSREWEIYRNFYLQLRGKYVQMAKGSCTNCFIGTDGVGQVDSKCNPGVAENGISCPTLQDLVVSFGQWVQRPNSVRTRIMYVAHSSGTFPRAVSIRIKTITTDPLNPAYPDETYSDLTVPKGSGRVEIGEQRLQMIDGGANPPQLETRNVSFEIVGITCTDAPPPVPGTTSYCSEHLLFPDYKLKTRVFREYIDMSRLSSCSVNLGTPPSNNQSLRDAALEDLKALENNWLATLQAVRDEEFPALAAEGQPLENAKLTTLVNRLYQVGKKSIEIADNDNIRLARNLPEGVVSSLNDASFAQVFASVIGSELVNQGFNEYLLNTPYPLNVKPYTISPQVSEVTNVICNNVSALKAQWTSAGAPGTFHQYLKTQLKEDFTLSIQELDDLMNKCASSCPIRLLNNTIAAPVAFVASAPVSVMCAQITAERLVFNNTYSQVNPDSKLYRTLLTNYLNHKWGYSLSFDELASCSEQPNLVLYNKPATRQVEYDDFACAAGLIKDALTTAGIEYEIYITEVRRKFRNEYISTCLSNQANAKFKSQQREYHYTLYYYDQSGTLVKTVPPEGVRFLEGEELTQVETFRGDDPEGCLEYKGPVEENKTLTLNSISSELLNGNGKAMELWLYDANVENFSRQVRFVAPDKRFFYQLAIYDKKIWVEVYSMTPEDNSISLTLSNHSYADISNLPRPLQGWTHVFVQSVANNLAAGNDLQLYVDGEKLTTITGRAALPYPFMWEITGDNLVPADDLAVLKHLRLYRRTATDAEIWANYKNLCLTPRDLLANKAEDEPTKTQTNPLSVWGRFNVAPSGSETNIAEGIEWAQRMILPKHTLPAIYRYNSLNQVVLQNTPDAGVSGFYYDILGRLVASQNAEQKLPAGTINDDNPANRFSYTRYDALGRIKEVGERLPLTSPPADAEVMSEEVARDRDKLAKWLNEGRYRQVTVTAYDKSPSWLPAGITQRNLLRRVAATALLTSGTDASVNREAASYYTYDIAGNVDVLVQENKKLAEKEAQYVTGSNGLKRLAYEYDLVSGKVNKVKYQEGKYDQFYYSYKYDAENRLIEAASGRNPLALKSDARYTYYYHGPLARIELGNDGVQGLDYVYTLQGWMKGMNSQFLDPAKDMGNDGYDANQQHKYVARDAAGFSLGYYVDDYLPIGMFTTAGAPAFDLTYGAPDPVVGKELYNGNINHSTYANRKFDGANIAVGKLYRYDQLNRLTEMLHIPDLSVTDGWPGGNTSQSFQAYREKITYDGNGNIKTYLRNGPAAGLAMDNLTYIYTAGKNQLSKLFDAVQGTPDRGDIKGTTNYAYDKIGNLISEDSDDNTQDINNISWTVYGKIAGIAKPGGTNISYGYDAGGNRITKSLTNGSSTYYVRDAQGNVMGVYGLTNNVWSWSEQHLYGSSRLGMLKPNLNGPLSSDVFNNINDQTENTGNRFFELTNHLGNVLATVSDRKIAVSGNGTTVDYYDADVVSAQDYYPFGMLMPGRNYNAAGYRYGFNSKENDNEVKGEGNQQDYGMRIYDPRVGRFLSVDPLTQDYPWYTPYQFAGNKPIKAIDIDGLEEWELSTVRHNLLRDAMLSKQAADNTARLANEQRARIMRYLRSLPAPQLNQAKQFTPMEAQQHEAARARKLGDAGYNSDGSPKPLARLAGNEHFSKFANNIALPIVEAAAAEGVARLTFEGVAILAKYKSPQYVYRSLRPDEAASVQKGLGVSAKNPEGIWTLDEHLTKGSSKASWANDPWVATSSDKSIAESFNSGNGMIRINLSKLPEGTVVQKGFEVLPRSAPGYHYSVWQQETSILGEIPQSAIKLIKK